MFIAQAPHQHRDTVVADGHCVRFVQAVSDAPHTSEWRQGIQARGGDLPAGTVIATFDPDGRYANATDGSSHAAVLIAEQAEGLLVYDQWQDHPVQQRLIRFRGGEGKAANDGDRFYAVTVVA